MHSRRPLMPPSLDGKDSTVSRYIPMTCGEPHSPIAHKTSRTCRHLLPMTSVKPHIHVLMHHWWTHQQQIQDLSVPHIKASFPIRLAVALHNNCMDLNSLIAQHTRIRMISYCIQGRVFHSFLWCTYFISHVHTYCISRRSSPSNNKFWFPLQFQSQSTRVCASSLVSFSASSFSLSPSLLHALCIAFAS